MELIVINEDKLKITMSAHEMHEMGLEENEFYTTASDSRRILKNILERLNVATGLEHPSPDDKILMQLYPEKEGGCELFITRLRVDCDLGASGRSESMASCERGEHGEMGEAKLPVLYMENRTSASAEWPTLTYRFDHLRDAVGACVALQRNGFVGESKLWCRQNNCKNELYLTVTQKQDAKEGRSLASPATFLSEFGILCPTERTLLMLSEHGKCIISDDAAKTLSEFELKA